jgi:hypothetical protein
VTDAGIRWRAVVQPRRTSAVVTGTVARPVGVGVGLALTASVIEHGNSATIDELADHLTPGFPVQFMTALVQRERQSGRLAGGERLSVSGSALHELRDRRRVESAPGTWEVDWVSHQLTGVVVTRFDAADVRDGPTNSEITGSALDELGLPMDVPVPVVDRGDHVVFEYLSSARPKSGVPTRTMTADVSGTDHQVERVVWEGGGVEPLGPFVLDGEAAALVDALVHRVRSRVSPLAEYPQGALLAGTLTRAIETAGDGVKRFEVDDCPIVLPPDEHRDTAGFAAALGLRGPATSDVWREAVADAVERIGLEPTCVEVSVGEALAVVEKHLGRHSQPWWHLHSGKDWTW